MALDVSKRHAKHPLFAEQPNSRLDMVQPCSLSVIPKRPDTQ